MRKNEKKITASETDSVRGNATKAKLKGTPFSSAEDLKAAQSAILSEAWKKLEKARAKSELLKRNEFRFYTDTFRKGLHCNYIDNVNSIVGISLGDDDVIKISIGEQVLPRKKGDQALLGILVESMAATFLQNYLKAMDILEDVTEPEKGTQGLKKNLLSKQLEHSS